MATVVFDLLFAQPVGGAKFHGGGEYIKTVFEFFIRQYDGTYPLEVCYNQDIFLDDWLLRIIKEKNIGVHQVKTADDIVAILKKLAKRENVRFFAGMIYPYDHYDFPDNIIRIGTCHGLRGMEKPYDTTARYYISSKGDIKEWIKFKCFPKKFMRNYINMYSSALQKFNIIITVSNHSAYAIRVNFPRLVQSTKIHVCYTPNKYIEPIKEKVDEKVERYILMISANRWLKNGYRGVKVLDGLYKKGYLKGIKTRIYGNLPKRIQRGLKCKENFEFYGYVSTENLERAYRDCEFFFYPSLNEGFGLPPMEAMKYGKTCVISNICSLPEVYGESVYYCNPYDIMEMQNRILQAVDKKIPTDVINSQIAKIRGQQELDLLELCKYIAGQL